MSQQDETLIRDADLRKELENARGTLTFKATQSYLIGAQARRDTERDAKAEKESALAAMPRDTRRRAIIREVIENTPPNRKDLQHIHSTLAICGLPYTRQALDVREYKSKQGEMSLMVQAGQLISPDDEWIPQPLPYGSRARLLLLHLCTQALHQQSPTIEIEDSLTAFVRAMGFSDSGGPRGDLTAFKQQLNALAACTLRIGVSNGVKARTITTAPFSALDVWFPSDPRQRILWPSTITFSREFFDTLSQHALPANTHAVRAFAGSPRKLDLYFWLIYRLNVTKDPLRITWASVKAQFGAGYARERAFRTAFAEDVAHLKQVFPKLQLALDDNGLTLQPASPEVLAVPAPSSGRKTLKK
jgi:hypothetical protein